MYITKEKGKEISPSPLSHCLFVLGTNIKVLLLYKLLKNETKLY